MNMRENRFSGLVFAAAQKLYRELLKKNHPDLGGSEEETKKIIAEFEAYCKIKVDRMAADFETQYKRPFTGREHFAEMLAKVIHLDGIRIEIIGVWIYCFDSYEVRGYLASIGFWFSAKHKAWIFSGEKKKRFHTRMTTDQIRQKLGCEKIETERQEKVTA